MIEIRTYKTSYDHDGQASQEHMDKDGFAGIPGTPRPRPGVGCQWEREVGTGGHVIVHTVTVGLGK